MTKERGKKTTVRGIAQRTKMGLYIGGVLVPDGVLDVEEYVDKLVEVTGYVTEDQGLVVEPYEKGKPISQGYETAPSVMRNIVSIKILEE